MTNQPERTRDSRAPEGNFHPTFNFEGHRVIALVMMADLKVRSVPARTRVDAILRDGNRTVLDAATFPDAIRDAQPQTRPFHFIDIRFVENGPAEPPLPGPPNVLSAIETFTDVLQSQDATAVQRVDALSWLIHLFGDVHQPLHCITRVNQFHPNGDRGGNPVEWPVRPAIFIRSGTHASILSVAPGRNSSRRPFSSSIRASRSPNWPRRTAVSGRVRRISWPALLRMRCTRIPISRRSRRPST